MKRIFLLMALCAACGLQSLHAQSWERREREEARQRALEEQRIRSEARTQAREEARARAREEAEMRAQAREQARQEALQYSLQQPSSGQEYAAEQTAGRTSGGSRMPDFGGMHYQGDVAVGYGLGFEGWGALQLETVHGLRFSDMLFAGLGLGFCYDVMGETNALLLPAFVNLKSYYRLSDRLSLFGSFDLGAGVGVSDAESGFYAAVGPGVDFGGKRGFDFSLRYQYIVGGSALQFRLGFRF